jgi:geranylgeranyl diphosphate synthase type II
MSLDLGQYLQNRAGVVDRELEGALPLPGDLSDVVAEAMRYSLLAGGKRLRPILCLAGCEAVGGTVEQALPAAAALEMIHCSSLIHDDLPGMDDDDLRRGRPTNHKVYGEGVAILAGDALLLDSLGHLARAAAEGRVDPGRALRALSIIADAAGHRGMVGGQGVDLTSENQNPGLDTVRFIHAKKTGALLSAAAASGGVMGGGTNGQINALAEYGLSLGLAFQIADDILDVEGDPEQTGKPVGSDQAKGKATYISAVGLAAAKAEKARLLDRTIDALSDFGSEADPLREIAQYLETRKK